jgi:GNAT superfamily N-acetyltransferase
MGEMDGASHGKGRTVFSRSEITVQLLADYPSLIPSIGEIRWREWGHPPEPEALGWWVEVTAKEAGRSGLPITWVAVDAKGQGVGAVGLNKFDIDERLDRSPWVIGMIVVDSFRGQGIGGQLLATLEVWVKSNGFRRLWVATGGQAVAFYQKYGWELSESFQKITGDEVTILLKDL